MNFVALHNSCPYIFYAYVKDYRAVQKPQFQFNSCMEKSAGVARNHKEEPGVTSEITPTGIARVSEYPGQSTFAQASLS